MAPLALVRVDDRLIHGQVVVKWLRHLACKRIWIVDDGVADDPYMQKVLRLAAPPGVKVDIAAVCQDEARLRATLQSPARSMILMKTPETALALLRCGVRFQELNVGGLAAGPGTVRLYKSVSANKEQIATLRTIAQMGVRVYFRMVPEERPAEMETLLPLRHQPFTQG